MTVNRCLKNDRRPAFRGLFSVTLAGTQLS
jgi:hypothetical protein